MKYVITLIFLIFSASLIANTTSILEEGFSITGKVTSEEIKSLKITYQEKGEKVTKDVELLRGRFTLDGSVLHPHKAIINFLDAKGEELSSPGSFYIENSNMRIDISKDPEMGYVIKVMGSLSHSEYTVLEEKMNDIYKRLSKLYEEMETEVQGFYRNKPDSYVAASVMKMFYKEMSYEVKVEDVEADLAGFNEEIRNSSIGKEILALMETYKKTQVGQIAMDVAQNNTEGELVKLSSLRGKYVLLDFWASWCGPCRKENPNLKATYEKYHDQGFEIYAVSLDVTKANWIKAIEEDGLPWIHVSDLRSDNEAATQYNVVGVPTNYLLDKEGKIIAVNVHGDDLNKILEKSFQ